MPIEKKATIPVDTGRAEQLQFLRFLAFFNVYITHAEDWIFFQYPTSRCGTAAVSFFFMLSGLVTGYSLFGRDIHLGLRDQGKYLWKKLKKVYPLYFFTTLYTFLYYGVSELTAIVERSEFPMQLLRNLLLLQSWFQEGPFTYNSVGWFLSTLLFLWLLNLPVMFLLNKVASRPRGWFLLLAGLGGVLFLTAVYCYLTKPLDMTYWQYIFPPARAGEYLSGMILGVLIRLVKPHLKSEKSTQLLFTVLEVGALCYWFYMLSHSGGSWRMRIYAWLLPNVFVLSFFTCGIGWISVLFRWKPLVRLGDVSFECFLIHKIFIMQYAIAYGVHASSEIENAVIFLLCLALTLMLSFLIHKWPEKQRISSK